MKAFKETDLVEKKVRDIALPLLNILSGDRTQFFNEGYVAYPLGDVLFDLRRDPLAGVITKEVYRISFPAIHDLFTRSGTFEFYMDVFRSIWGENVEVVFTIPSPGVLQINVEALDSQTELFMARRVENDVYFFDEVMDHEGDNLVFQGTQGIKTQGEIDALINELHPAGVYVETTLVIE